VIRIRRLDYRHWPYPFRDPWYIEIEDGRRRPSGFAPPRLWCPTFQAALDMLPMVQRTYFPPSTLVRPR
jgi:hypothetical protein